MNQIKCDQNETTPEQVKEIYFRAFTVYGFIRRVFKGRPVSNTNQKMGKKATFKLIFQYLFIVSLKCRWLSPWHQCSCLLERSVNRKWLTCLTESTCEDLVRCLQMITFQIPSLFFFSQISDISSATNKGASRVNIRWCFLSYTAMEKAVGPGGAALPLVN